MYANQPQTRLTGRDESVSLPEHMALQYQAKKTTSRSGLKQQLDFVYTDTHTLQYSVNTTAYSVDGLKVISEYCSGSWSRGSLAMES